MALSFTEGSIGGDIERLNLEQLQAFYGKAPVGASRRESHDHEGAGGVERHRRSRPRIPPGITRCC